MNTDIKTMLAEALGNARRVAILGCGSELLGDDAAGMRVAGQLEGLGENVRAFCGSTAPENFSGVIKRFRPEALLVVDAADMGRKPGEAALIPIEKIDGVSFSTHMLPLKIMLEYLHRETGCSVSLLGIQSASVEFGTAMTPEVTAAVDAVAAALRELLAEA